MVRVERRFSLFFADFVASKTIERRPFCDGFLAWYTPADPTMTLVSIGSSLLIVAQATSAELELGVYLLWLVQETSARSD